MRYTPVLACLALGLAQVAVADDDTPFKWTKERFELVGNADIEAGQGLAKKLRCARCHNDNGISDEEDVPSIAGQRATYMYKQMHDFRLGLRDNEEMAKVAKRMSDQDMVDVSAWYATMPRPAKLGGAAPLVVKVCDSCHSEEIVEEDDHIEVAPILEGQIRQYLEDSMQAFRDAERSNDLFDRMQSVSHKLSEREVKDLARYYGAAPVE